MVTASRTSKKQAKQLYTCITLFCRFLCRPYLTTTWKCLISRFMEGVNKRGRNFLTPSGHGRYISWEINFRWVRLHIKKATSSSNHDKDWKKSEITLWVTCSRRSHRSRILGPHSRGYNWCHERSKSNSQKRFTLVLAILLSSRYLWSRQWYRIWRPLNIKGLNKMQFGYAAKHKALQSCTYIAASTVMDFLTYISSLCFHSCACPKDTLLNQSPPQPGKRCKLES